MTRKEQFLCDAIDVFKHLIVNGECSKQDINNFCDFSQRELDHRGVSGGHFNRMYADEAVKKMYYEDAGGTKHYAPYFTEDEVEEIFEKHKDDVSDYTIFDLAVTLNMMRSDNARFLHKYAKDDAQAKQMVIDMAVEYLQDPDAPHPHSKVWHYLKG